MNPNSEIHRRRSIRLSGYDYSQPGAYFVTLVTKGRACLFGEIIDGEMRLNDAGLIVLDAWNYLPARFPGAVSGAAVVMPNHFHGIVEIQETDVNPVGAIHDVVHPIYWTKVKKKERTEFETEQDSVLLV